MVEVALQGLIIKIGAAFLQLHEFHLAHITAIYFALAGRIIDGFAL